MSHQPLVSIICLCYNHADYVVEALDSVIRQSYQNVEIIIVDDCSKDDSASTINEWCLHHPTVIFVENTSNIGNTKSFNKALKLSTGNYLIDFATDDVMLEDCVATLLDRMLNSTFENTGVVHCNALLIDEKGNETGYFFPVDSYGKVQQKIPTGLIYAELFNSGQIICPITMLVKREVYEALGGYDESLAYEDLDFWIRSSRRFDYDFADMVLSKKRILSNSLGSQYKRKFSKRANAINNSTYKILKSAFENNTSKTEDTAVMKRVHYEITVAFNTFNVLLLWKYLVLKVRLRLKVW